MINRIKNNKFLLVLLCLITICLGVLIYRISYAYLMEHLDESKRAKVDINLENMYNLEFIPGAPLNLDVTAKTLPEDGDDLSIVSMPRVELKDPNPENVYHYYVYLTISSNPFVYTEEGTPEILLKIKKGEEDITQIENLSYNTELQAFDITQFKGTIPIREAIEMYSNGTSLTTEEWTFTLIYRNLDIDQSVNLDKSLSLKTTMQEEEKELAYHVTCNDDSASCTLAKTAFTSEYMLYHDEYLTNGAGDLSYRYVGANPNNYVCFGSECSTNPEDQGYKNLYRIIGFFKNGDQYETKIIKADAATEDDLGTDGAYYGNYTNNIGFYKGKLTTFPAYNWNTTDSDHIGNEDNTNTNMWKDSNLNKENLNGTYYGNIPSPYKEMVVEHEWQVGAAWDSGTAKSIYDHEIGDNKLTTDSVKCYTQDGSLIMSQSPRQCNQENDLTYKAKVGLIYVSDYMFATLPEHWNNKGDDYALDEVKTNNWMYLGMTEWTITRYPETEEDGISLFAYARRIHYKGIAGGSNRVHNANDSAVRPVLYLSSDVRITGGSGTDAAPYTLGM